MLSSWKLVAGLGDLWVPGFPVLNRSISSGLFAIVVLVNAMELMKYLYALFDFVTVTRLRLCQLLATIISIMMNGGVYFYGWLYFSINDDHWAAKV
jgi:hypothetical protein